MAAVGSGAAMAGDRRHAQLNQRNGDIEIVQRDNTLRMQRHGHRPPQIIGKGAGRGFGMHRRHRQ